MVVSCHSSTSEVSNAVIRSRNVVKSYGTGGTAVYALRGVTFDVQRGERVALLGKSGSGKSTLLHLLGGLDHATSGGLEVQGHDLGRLSSHELTCFRSATVGMIFQGFNLIPTRTVIENVELPMVFAGRPRRERRAEAQRVLEAVDLGARLYHRPAELSGGESQRVAIARALVTNPELVLADEPTANLDSVTSEQIIDLMQRLNSEKNVTFLFSTHDPRVMRHAKRVVHIADGRITE
jgi:ABC-type lipoprotein export system ATPase subunit